MSNTQEAYIQTLRQIKDAENAAEKEIETRRREVEDEIRDLQLQFQNLIEAAKNEGEKRVIKSIEEAGKKAQAEADSIINEAQIKSKNISAHVDDNTARTIISILLGVE
jgi:V/A-type H+/Na+-transporting ATPase subunit G/H